MRIKKHKGGSRSCDTRIEQRLGAAKGAAMCRFAVGWWKKGEYNKETTWRYHLILLLLKVFGWADHL
jgi:hypothetical protein